MKLQNLSDMYLAVMDLRYETKIKHASVDSHYWLAGCDDYLLFVLMCVILRLRLFLL
jgi:hypothetical protein